MGVDQSLQAVSSRAVMLENIQVVFVPRDHASRYLCVDVADHASREVVVKRKGACELFETRLGVKSSLARSQSSSLLPSSPSTMEMDFGIPAPKARPAVTQREPLREIQNLPDIPRIAGQASRGARAAETSSTEKRQREM